MNDAHPDDVHDLLVTNDYLAQRGAQASLELKDRKHLEKQLVLLAKRDPAALRPVRMLLAEAARLSGVSGPGPGFRWWVGTKELHFEHRGIEVTLLIGPPGSGKTTRLLELLARSPGVNVLVSVEANDIAERLPETMQGSLLARRRLDIAELAELADCVFLDAYRIDEVERACNALNCKRVIATIQTQRGKLDQPYKLGVFWLAAARHDPRLSGPAVTDHAPIGALEDPRGRVELTWLRWGLYPINSPRLAYEANRIMDEDGRVLKDRFAPTTS